MPKISRIRIIESPRVADSVPASLAGDLEWVQKRGVEVERLHPEEKQEGALPGHPAALATQGPLPLVLVDGRVTLSGRYPTREEMGIWMMFGLAQAEERNTGGIRACTL